MKILVYVKGLVDGNELPLPPHTAILLAKNLGTQHFKGDLHGLIFLSKNLRSKSKVNYKITRRYRVSTFVKIVPFIKKMFFYNNFEKDFSTE